MTGRRSGTTIVRVTRPLSVPFGKAAVSDVMTPGVISCAPATPLRTVARLMATHRVHAIVVDDGADWRIVSDLDLVGSAHAADELTACSVAATPLVTVAADETLERAAQLMAENESAHLVVVEPAADTPLGVVSTLDIARALAVEELLRNLAVATPPAHPTPYLATHNHDVFQEAAMPDDTLTITDNRTGRTYEVPIVDGTIRATDLRQIKVDDDDFGLMSYDPAFLNTASTRSAITYIDGDERHPPLPRLPDRAARRAEHVSRDRLPAR